VQLQWLPILATTELVQQFQIEVVPAAHIQPVHLCGLCPARTARALATAGAQLGIEEVGGNIARGAAMNDRASRLLGILEAICEPIRRFWSAWDFAQPSRAEIRREKRERRQARHYAMTHGKHGLKRPRSKRNVARN
jgi:hypothetical protein